MDFLSDNAASACPEVLASLIEANAPDRPYDADSHSRNLDGAFSTLFDTEVTALWVTTGTAANALALATLCPPYGAILCHADAHIQNDECGAPEFYSHGAKLLPIAGSGAKLTPESVRDCLSALPPDVHRMQPHVLSLTNATEYGCVYTPDEVAALGLIAREQGLGFHMDGARFANAVVTLGCSPADLTWKAGVDVLSFGFVKNGGLSAEALIFFRPDLAAEARIRRKRGGHLVSKGRYNAAQLLAMLKDDVWLRNARAANEGARRIAEASPGRLLYPVEANELFLRLSAAEAALLRDQGFGFYDWGENLARFVISWDQPEESIARLIAALNRL
ncbi:MAG: low specificity L-threonine aldolase [Sphingobium sp.]